MTENLERAEREGGPDPVDVYVGSRIKLRRTVLGLSQERLADALGVTFQQVQKYERGTNRVSASRLAQIARALSITIAWFFNEQPDRSGFHEGQQDFGTGSESIMQSRETAELVRAYYRISSPAARKSVYDLMKSLGSSED